MGALTAGIDIGSVAVKSVLYMDGSVRAHAIAPTGWNPGDSGSRILDEMLRGEGVSQCDLACIVTTGYGRNTIREGFPVTEITCHAAGASHLFPDARMVLDIGGQDSKAIRIGPGGAVLDFLMNDKCAAGTGRFLQNMAVLLEYGMEDFSSLPDDADPHAISNMCTVFAETEVIGLLARGVDKTSLALGLLDSVAARAEGLIRKLGGDGPIAFTGGLSGSRNLKLILERKTGAQVLTNDLSQFAGAIGAAVIAMKKAVKQG
ncbi:MAG: acyl-CoA dehydratase activase [Synergistaceae bacterium]|jgi:predicted CoA-substrate-specific enzyme activase|nr:acyl-CoA dehydratase activase [Synergistaceae bacterium]